MPSHRPRRTTRFRALVALALIAAVPACTPRQDKGPGPGPAQAPPPIPPAPPAAADPMAPFARLVGGEWRVTYTSGASAFQSWRWGPGRHSVRKTMEASDAPGNPWTGDLLYWHPGRKQVRLLSLHEDIPGIGRGVGEGTISFDGETAAGILNLSQPRGLRKLGLRWAFDGPDKYHDTLLEDSGSGLKPLAEWDFVRIPPRPEPRPIAADPASKPSGRLQAFATLVGHTWEAKGDLATGHPSNIQSTFQWLPSLEVIYARVEVPSSEKGGAPTPLLDAYCYRPIGTDEVRCLALSNAGGVYEGDLTVLEGGTLQLDLKGYEGERVVPLVVRLDLEKDGTLRSRHWSVEGPKRTLIHDARHRKVRLSAAPFP